MKKKHETTEHTEVIDKIYFFTQLKNSLCTLWFL